MNQRSVKRPAWVLPIPGRYLGPVIYRKTLFPVFCRIQHKLLLDLSCINMLVILTVFQVILRKCKVKSKALTGTTSRHGRSRRDIAQNAYLGSKC